MLGASTHVRIPRMIRMWVESSPSSHKFAPIMCCSPAPSFTKGNTRRSITHVKPHHDVSINFKDSIVNNRNRYINQQCERTHPTKPPNDNVIILATVDSQGKFCTKIVLSTCESMWGSRNRILGIPWAHEWHGCEELSCRRIVDLAIGQVTKVQPLLKS